VDRAATTTGEPSAARDRAGSGMMRFCRAVHTSITPTI
jgi:hypothetical protein